MDKEDGDDMQMTLMDVEAGSDMRRSRSSIGMEEGVEEMNRRSSMAEEEPEDAKTK